MTSIIRKNTIETQSRVVRGVQFDYEDLAQQADAYLANVQQQAQDILERAHAEAEELRAEARQQGRDDARREAEAAAMARVDEQLGSLLPAVQQTVSQVQEMRHAWLHRWEKQLLGLAEQIAARVIRRELQHDIQITHTWVREALELVSDCKSIRLRLHPHDYEMLQNQTSGLQTEFSRLAETDIVADPTLAAGECCIDTEFGCVDQRIETQLARIREALQ